MSAVQELAKVRDVGTATGTVRASVADSFDALKSIRDDWDRFIIEEGAPVFQSFDALRTWWSHYGRGALHLFVFRVDLEIVGIVPIFVETIRLGPASVRLAAIVGSDSTLVVEALAVRSEWRRAAFSTLLEHLFKHAACDAVKLTPLSAADERIDDLRAAVGDRSDLCTMYLDETREVHTMFELPQSFDEYLASLNRKQRGGYRRSMKDMTDAHGLKVDVLEDEAGLSDAFPEFEKLHEAQWSAEGKLGHFQDWPGSSAYHAELLRVLGAHRRAHLLRMSCDGQIVSYQLCYAMGDVLHWVLPARSLRPELERYSLGRLGLIGLIEFAIGAGFRRIEGGLGHYDYKLQLGAKEHPARTVVVAANGATQRLRIGTFNLVSRALDFIYYEFWFLRLAPKLPLRRRPLWNLWIRTRL